MVAYQSDRLWARPGDRDVTLAPYGMHFLMAACGMAGSGVLAVFPSAATTTTVMGAVGVTDANVGQELAIGLAAGTAIGTVVAAAITAFGTAIFRPWLDHRSHKTRAEQLQVQVNELAVKVDHLEKVAGAAETERFRFLDQTDQLHSRYAKHISELNDKNLRLIHHFLVVVGRQRPGEIPPAGPLLGDFGHVLIDDTPAQPSGPSVLLIEDAPGPQEAMKQILSRFGYRVEAVGTLAEGIEALDRKPDYIVLDLVLPDGNGVELLTKIRDERRTSKVVIATGHGEAAVLDRVRAMEPAAILIKPFDLFAELLPALGYDPKVTR